MKKKFNPMFEVSFEDSFVGNRELVVMTICTTPIQVSPQCQV